MPLKIRPCFMLICWMLICASTVYAIGRFEVIENFESGAVQLSSFENEDIQPNNWGLDSLITYNSSQYSLKLSGNAWKQQFVQDVFVDSSSVIQVAARTSSGAKIQGIGFSDGTNRIFYSFSGSLTLNIEIWVPVYQGAFDNSQWNLYNLPIGLDWYSFFGYSPIINSVIYVNDLDGVTSRSIWFDDVINITSDLPQAPIVTITTGQPSRLQSNQSNQRETSVQFYSHVLDSDSEFFSYNWSFGDGNFSSEPNPMHIYSVADAHQYSVVLRVTDNSGRYGFAKTSVQLDAGDSTLPVVMNFIGDVMLGRRYENSGGIIQTQGVNSIFTPTLPILGQAADITVANLEVVLSDIGTPHPTKSVVYRGSPGNVSGLSYAGIDVVSLANNHVLDYGLTALNQMKGLLDNAGILHSGAGVDSYEANIPAMINSKGLNIAFLRSSDRTGQYNNAQPYLQAGFNKPGFAYMTPFYVQQQINSVSNIADLKIVEMHGGSEYSIAPGANYDKSSNPFIYDTDDEDYTHRIDVPHQWDIAIRHSAIDNGADMVIVHHPHIIQGIEIYNGKLIAHSLGNFAFDLNYPECMPSMILYADADFTGFSNYRVRPVYIDAYIPKPSTGHLGLYTLEYLAMKSRELDTILLIDKNNNMAEVISDPISLIQYDTPFSTTIRFADTQENIQYSKPIKLPRSGSISSIEEINPNANTSARLGTELVWYGNMEDEGSSLWGITSYSSEAYDGERCAMLSTSTGQTLAHTIPLRLKIYDNTKKYTLHGWIKTSRVSSANVVIRFYNTRPSGGAISTVNLTDSFSGTNGWTWFYKEISIPSMAYYFDIQLTMTGSSGQASQALFDNVGLIEWTPWQEFAMMNSIPHPNNYYWIQLRTPELVKSLSMRLIESEYQKNHTILNRNTVTSSPTLNSYPNPFNPITTLSYQIMKQGRTSIRVYNLKGQMVKELFNNYLDPGKFTTVWDGTDFKGSNVSSGMYVVRLDNSGSVAVRKVILLK